MKKRWGPLTLVLLALMLVLAACGQPSSDAGETEENAAETGEGDEATSEGDESVTIGINQLVEHPSLDAAREGFMQAFADNGYTEGDNVTFDVQNAQGDQSTATSIANKFASDGVDLVLAIATPAAQATAQAITDIPVLITAVTEPVEAGLVESWEAPGSNVTGTSDLNPVADQLSLIPEIAPDAKTVGIVYSSGEVNSEVQVELAQEAADELGLELELATVSNKSEVLQAAQSLAGNVDAFYVPTDNTIVDALESMIQVAEESQIPLIVGEGDSVERGGLATWGINYEKLGYQTGEMAIKILEGENPADMPVETLEDIELSINVSAAERMGVDIPQELLDQADNVIE
ncbi:ABC transporter substrate-binding protein [Novibacillus thermophilus]|uniref:Sugar ABC transporter substrate-binding protein n=1 Tax=Novibacillus thermophilus TaxID=1471761 RepID=A0A1U9K495_9BACL|nr:ABC transporter substrate-binding protein [Novibacillus thermophilus]AQS54867.1 sugar ABC transporter substrate-binding protein [Novibacillus thermophilus]